MRYKALSVILIFSLLLLDIRLLYLSTFRATQINAPKTYQLETFGSGRGVIYDRNFKRLVENETTLMHSVVNPEFQLKVPLRYSDSQSLEHIIGYVDGENNGVTGLEKDYNAFLKNTGKPIGVKTYYDATGRLLKGKGSVVVNESSNEKNGLVLTVDSLYQTIAQEAGKKLKTGAVVIQNAENGKILTSVSFPRFDAAHPEKSVNEKNAPFLNRAVENFSVGSVFKIVVCMAALEKGISPSFRVRCSGSVQVGSHRFSCHKSEGHGVLDMKHALAFSCNPYFIALGNKVGAAAILEMCRKLGFSEKERLSESIVVPRATVPTLRDLSAEASLANFSFGQGELSASPIKVASVYSVVANGGFSVEPGIVECSYLSNDKKQIFKEKKQRVISKATAQLLSEYLYFTVSHGTGKNAYCEGIRTGGKTATAQTGVYDGKNEKLISYFVGFCKINGETLTVLVMKENGKSGSEDCAPIFREILINITIS